MMFTDDDWRTLAIDLSDEVTPLLEPGPKARPACYSCLKELSETLDAYYGKGNGGKYCVDCRYRLKVD